MRKMLGFMILALLTTPVAHAKKKKIPKTPVQIPAACNIPWQKIFSAQALQKVEDKPLIFIAPLKNDTALTGDEWISVGLAHQLQRYLSQSPAYGVLLESDAPQAISAAKYKITGLFQHTAQWLRIFIQLKDAGGELLAQWKVETPYPLHKQFFTGMSQTAQNIFSTLKTSPKNMAMMEIIAQETDKVRAYENYIKGKMALEKYDPNYAEVALIWFEESVREDNHYIQPHAGMMEAHGFLSLVHKQAGLPFNKDLEQLQESLQTIKKKGGASTLTHRYLQAHVHYVTGGRALERGDAAKAASELEQAVALAPEDGRTATYLSLAYDQLGKTDLAEKYRQRVKEINPCL